MATRLTNAGFEVGAIHRAGEHWDRIVVGEVVRIDPHPNADRLNLPTVNTGSDEVQVVCGAWNFEAGDRIAFAPAGARLWDPYADEPVLKELKPTRIRGVVSRGMLCSTKELGISDDHEGILVLDPDAPLGRPLAEALGGEVLGVRTEGEPSGRAVGAGHCARGGGLVRDRGSLADSRRALER